MHEREISFLASHLFERRVLYADDIARLCHQHNSPLKQFAVLYPKPRPVTRRPSLNNSKYQSRRSPQPKDRPAGWVTVSPGCGFFLMKL